MRGIVKYPGSKWNIASKLVNLIPEHHSYLEPFFGSGAILFTKSPSRIETINDRNGDVVNLFQCIQDDPERLARLVMTTPYINLYSDMEKLLMLSEILQDNDFCRYMVSHANPPKSYLEFIINGKPLRFQTVDQLAELTDSGTVKNIIDELYTGSSDETIKRFKEIRPKKIEE